MKFAFVDNQKTIIAKIALGTWAWGAGAFGEETVFGSMTDVETLKPVFDAAMKAGLSLWDTATAYGMGESERILGKLIHNYVGAGVSQGCHKRNNSPK